MIAVTVKLFAIYQETLGQDHLSLNLPAGSTVLDLLDRLVEDYPDLAPWRSVTRFGINLEFVPPETPLRSGDEIVFIPPVSGG
jgi:molybdopterin synthase sulfur carrier subunit